MINFWRFGFYSVISVAVGVSFPSQINADVALEDEIKAAYLYHILNFVNWPPDQTKSATSPINICIMGNDNRSQSLQKLAAKSISKRPINVLFLDINSPYSDCHLLFARHTPFGAISRLVQSEKQKAVLIVGDNPDFAKDGGMIGFVLKEQSVRIEINLNSIKKAGFTVSANLLEVAIKIYNGTEQDS